MPTPSDIPLRQLTLSNWAPVDVQNALEERPLLLHLRRQRSPGQPQLKRIILLVHGLNSSAATWLTFLAQAFQVPELEVFDFGLFNYQTSLFSRLNPFQRLPHPEDWAKVLASVIRNTIVSQERYDSYVLVGHSMGGLVSKFAIRHLMENDKPAATRLHSLFTYGTPNHGSDRANALGAVFSPDLALLRAFSAPIQDLQSFWNTRISALPDTPGKYTVHERAVVSVKDYWVAPASGISSLPEAFVERLASSHTALLKPVGPNDPRISWFVDQLRAIQRLSECTLIEIREGPRAEDFVGDDVGQKLIKGLFGARFVLDAGTADRVAKGDKFGLYYASTEVKDADGRVIDRIPSSMNLLGAIDVKERVTYCKLESFSYGAALESMDHALNALEKREDDSLAETEIEKLVLALFGRRAIRIQRAESDAHEKLEDIYGRVIDEKRGTIPRRKALLELLTACRDFLVAYPGSVLADQAAFREAWSTMELDRFEDAELLFERFCEDYPFSTSVEGARRWIEEIRLRIELRDSKDAPEAQLRLAEYLLKQERSVDEGIRLGFEAYARKPELLHRISAPLRFILTGQYLFHEVLGMDLEAPEPMGALVEQYRSDPAQRDQIRANIEAKAPPERAALLLPLLDSLEPAEKGSTPLNA
jgi:pimeloyl-ACP methyl ester carboxylesterase